MLCSAHKKNGEPCKQHVVKGKTKCHYHGGKSTGPPRGAKNALTHGIYAVGLQDEEKEIWDDVPVGDLDDIIRFLQIQLRRAAKALKEVEDAPDKAVRFELDELSVKTGNNSFGKTGEKTVKRKRPDYRAIIDRLAGRIGKLTQIRNEMKGDATPGDVTITVKHTRHDDD